MARPKCSPGARWSGSPVPRQTCSSVARPICSPVTDQRFQVFNLSSVMKRICSLVFYKHSIYSYRRKVYSLYTFICNGDVELNLGLILHSCYSFSICHWNLKSLSTHNFIKVSVLRIYITISRFDIICLSETYLDSSFLSKGANLGLTGYDLEQNILLIQKRVVFASTLTHFSPVSHFYTPWKLQVFWRFQGV